MQRVVATYAIDGHEVKVVEMIDDDATYYDLVADDTLIPVELRFERPPGEEDVRAIVREWSATAEGA